MGFLRLPVQAVDSATLPAAEEAELRRLVAALAAAEPVPDEGPGRIRDAMVSTISVQDGESLEVSQADGAMSPEFSELVRWITAHAR